MALSLQELYKTAPEKPAEPTPARTLTPQEFGEQAARLGPPRVGLTREELYAASPAPQGYLANIKNPLELWSTSAVANLRKANQAGVFDQTLSQMWQTGKEDVKHLFTREGIGQLIDHIAADPGKAGAELQNAIIQDPYLIFTPLGLGGALARGMAKGGLAVSKGSMLAGKVGATVGRGVEGAASGAVLGSTIEAAKMLKERGFISPEGLVGPAEMVALFGGAFNMGFGKTLVQLKAQPAAGPKSPANWILDESGKVVVEGKPHFKIKPAEVASSFDSPEGYATWLSEQAIKQAGAPPKPHIKLKVPRPLEEAAPTMAKQADEVLAKWSWAGSRDLQKDAASAVRRLGQEDLANYIEALPKETVESFQRGLALSMAAGFGVAFLDEEDIKAGGLGVLAMAAAIKAKGGMWHPGTVERLSSRLWEGRLGLQEGMPTTSANLATHPLKIASDRMIEGYLNKHAGTATDPLKDIEIPFGRGTKRWEEVTNSAFRGVKAKFFQDTDFPPTTQADAFSGARRIPQEEPIFVSGSPGEGSSGAAHLALSNYLSHVGDYLREFVPPAKLKNYDLVRAVRETAAQDAKQAAKMAEARASGAGTVTMKTYPDGYKWVEVGKGADKDVNTAALKNEGDVMGHCVGGYCEAVHEGKSQIFSLRDAKNNSHVTVEVRPPSGREIVEGVVQPKELPDIVQIKGKQNRAPVEDYLPYVQDFVKSGKWGRVGDIENSGLAKYQGQYYTAGELKAVVDDLVEKFQPGPRVTVLEHFVDKYKQGQLNTAHELSTLLDWFGNPEAAKLVPGRGQRGAIEPKVAARLAAIGITAAGAATLDPESPLAAALIGALGAGVATAISPTAVWKVVRRYASADKRVKLGDIGNAHEEFYKRAGLDIWRLNRQIESLVPDLERRNAITHAIEGDTSVQLTPNEHRAAQLVRQYFNHAKELGLQSEVLKDALDNYATHLWAQGTQGAVEEGSAFVKALEARGARGSMSPYSRFAEHREIPTLRKGKELGLTPVTEDISQILSIYGNSIMKSVANKRMLDALKAEKIPGGNDKFLMPAKDAPANYELIPHPQLAGQRVHPDLVPSLRFFFDTSHPGVLMRAAEGVSIASKRALVSFSLFHAKALTDAYIGAGGNPLKLKGFVSGSDELLQSIRHGGGDQLVDRAIKGGLMFTFERGKVAVEDVGDTFYAMMKDLQQISDQVIPGTGKAVKKITDINHKVDHFMWERLHAGMKLNVFAKEFDAVQQNNAAAHLRDPRVKLKTEAEISEIAASYTNDLFGGLNWRRIAEGMENRLTREIALAAFSPVGRRGLQLALFAPDWTISTTKAAVAAFGLRPSRYFTSREAGKGVLQSLADVGSGTGLRGLVSPQEIADLHRRYIIRSATYYLAAGSVLNKIYSGKWLWENEDPTTVDLGDGRKMQWSKHTMEPVHWLTKPRQQMLNKLGVPIRLGLETLTGKEYLSAYGAAPPITGGLPGYAAHVAKGLSPIAVQQAFDAGEMGGDPTSAIAGFLGAPIYGKTQAQRLEAKIRREAEEVEERIKRRMEKIGATR